MKNILKNTSIIISMFSIICFGAEADVRLTKLTPITEKADVWNVSYSSSESEHSREHSDDSDYSDGDIGHFSQSGYEKNKGGRQDFNDEIITKYTNKISGEINAFSSNPTFNTLTSLLEKIADAANKAYNEERIGSKIGTHKHTLCKMFLEKIKTDGGAFNNVYPEYPVGNSRFDVIWFKNKDAYVFDYKFGDETNTSTSSRAKKYKQDLNGIGYNMVGGIKDIHP